MEHLDNNTRKNAHEATALLTPSTEATGVQTDTPPSPRTRCSWPWTHVVALCAAIVITANVAGYLSKAPKIRLFESVLCNEHWLSEEPSVVRDDGSVPEALCKIDVVQDRLATILGWQLFFDSIPAILLPIPYGYLADKYGRKWILVAAIFGVAASFASILFVVGFFHNLLILETLPDTHLTLLIIGRHFEVASSIRVVVLTFRACRWGCDRRDGIADDHCCRCCPSRQEVSPDAVVLPSRF